MFSHMTQSLSTIPLTDYRVLGLSQQSDTNIQDVNIQDVTDDPIEVDVIRPTRIDEEKIYKLIEFDIHADTNKYVRNILTLFLDLKDTDPKKRILHMLLMQEINIANRKYKAKLLITEFFITLQFLQKHSTHDAYKICCCNIMQYSKNARVLLKIPIDPTDQEKREFITSYDLFVRSEFDTKSQTRVGLNVQNLYNRFNDYINLHTHSVRSVDKTKYKPSLKNTTRQVTFIEKKNPFQDPINSISKDLSEMRI